MGRASIATVLAAVAALTVASSAVSGQDAKGCGNRPLDSGRLGRSRY
jgi:hypothetical protein